MGSPGIVQAKKGQWPQRINIFILIQGKYLVNIHSNGTGYAIGMASMALKTATEQRVFVSVLLYSQHDFAPPTILWGFLICPLMWVSFFGGIQNSPVDGCSATSCNFGVLAGEDECTSFYSTSLGYLNGI